MRITNQLTDFLIQDFKTQWEVMLNLILLDSLNLFFFLETNWLHLLVVQIKCFVIDSSVLQTQKLDF